MQLNPNLPIVELNEHFHCPVKNSSIENSSKKLRKYSTRSEVGNSYCAGADIAMPLLWGDSWQRVVATIGYLYLHATARSLSIFIIAVSWKNPQNSNSHLFDIFVRQSLDSLYNHPNRSPSKSFDLKNHSGEKIVRIFALLKILEKLRFGCLYNELHVSGQNPSF